MKEPIISLTLLMTNLINLIQPGAEQMYTPVQQQQQAILASKNAIDTMMKSLLLKQNFPLSPNWTIEELTNHLIEEERIIFIFESIQ